MSKKLLIPALLLCVLQCTSPVNIEKAKASWKEEIRQTEAAFNSMAAKQGLKAAFLAFADEEAVLKRGNQIIKGKAAIGEYFDRQTAEEVSLSWEPEFIDVSAGGDMGYTYGPFTFSARDTSGQLQESTGVFHTVWKRQEDGTWRYVYD